jgi:hypothetical protein
MYELRQFPVNNGIDDKPPAVKGFIQGFIYLGFIAHITEPSHPDILPPELGEGGHDNFLGRLPRCVGKKENKLWCRHTNPNENGF